MGKSFTITTTATENLKADAKGHAQAVFTIINTTASPVRGLARAKPLGDTKREWLSIAGDAERDFGRGTDEQFTVRFDAADAPAGKFKFRLDVASAVKPEEDFTEGPAVTVEVAAIVVDGGGGWRWPVIVIAAVVLLVGGTLSWLIWRRTKPAPKPEVALYKLPDVADTGEGKAKERLERECVAPDKPCVLVEVNQVFDDHVGEGRTIRTEPAAGTEVPLGSKVLLVTSRGPLLVPSVANQPEDAARKLLETMCEQGRCKVEVSFSNDDKVAKGIAIRTVPGENEVVKTSTVTLVVSSGPELKAVGSYIGMTREVAENQIRNDGFTVGTIATIRDHRADHPFTFPNVQRQDPPPGTLRPKGSKVDIGIRVE